MVMYVDGFNLYNGLHQSFGRKYLWLDLVKLAEALRPKNDVLQVKYFTAPVLNEPGAQARQNSYWQALQTVNGGRITIIQGRYQGKNRTCRSCNSTWTVYEEKETDVSIAVSLVADAARNAADSFLLVSGDSDLAPAVRMAKELNPRSFVTAAFPPARFSAELKRLMPASFHIGRAKIAQCQLPDPVLQADGTVLHRRPSKWK
ncbi:Uncharacterized conserved protein, LabA/DUF88 family [Arthrobacter subterraneus]|uniref:Uncharacterized conserved protein, LabA/DUF88 family n=1 Tax=Arthrobacter subterraneus TaxID=335973 RepID=A0A1G8KS59_9MICC|nr:NYN domain-containing protein [Arthrobacter subterraneus]SDI46209.1 Uncharacterized conserved protein, LabA/DUF88 family [Arthrobacter subterraneus]